MKSILTLTINPCVDLCASVDHVFPNHKLRCGPMSSEPGGGGINVSRAIKRLGGTSLAVYSYGGPTGDLLRSLINLEDVESRPLPIEGWTRQSVTICETTTGQQFRFVMPGPEIQKEEWERPLGLLRSITPRPEIIVASGSLAPGVPEDFYARVARVASERGAMTIIDTSGEPLERVLAEDVFLIKPSLRELRAISRSRLDHETEQAKAAIAVLRRSRCRNIVVSLGSAGALLATPEGCERIHAPVVSVRSRVGAGDSMVAGIALGLAEGRTLRESVAYGILCGTAAVMNAGTALCRKDDVDWLYGLRSEKKLDCDFSRLSSVP